MEERTSSMMNNSLSMSSKLIPPNEPSACFFGTLNQGGQLLGPLTVTEGQLKERFDVLIDLLYRWGPEAVVEAIKTKGTAFDCPANELDRLASQHEDTVHLAEQIAATAGRANEVIRSVCGRFPRMVEQDQ
jgi:hypothetical protein